MLPVEVMVWCSSYSYHRVSPGLSLLDLRSALSEQLDPDVLPSKYVFLRNVGRHMALVCVPTWHMQCVSSSQCSGHSLSRCPLQVSAWQEERFKVAIFAPPFVSQIQASC